jgi:uncharacterized protein
MADDFFIVDGPGNDASITLILAHGAGAPMDSPFMNTIAEAIAATGVRVARFEFPYMAERRRSGKRHAPDREPVLMQSWRAAIERLGQPGSFVIGGKSLGGRIASMIADQVGAAGLICLGYPFHPPGNPSRLRTGHLEALRTPSLFLQGTRDPFGRQEEVAHYHLSPAIRLTWIEDGDHSLKPRASSGRTEAQNLSDAIAHACSFIAGLKVTKRPGGAEGI